MSDSRAGLASLTVNGVNYDVAGDLKADPTNLKREMLIGQSGVQGHKVTPKTGFISANLRLSRDIIVREFQDMTSVTVVGVMASGKSFSGSNLTQTAECEVDTAEGTFPVKFEGEVEEG